MTNFKTGVNFGCWISQYSELDYDLFRKMTTRDDVRRIRDWGFDHIRLPFDYPILLDDGDLYNFKSEGIAFLDDMVEWCRDAGVSLMLDLHYAPGYRFQDKGRNKLFESDEYKNVFIALWVQMAKRYKDVGEMLAFDLLNEVAENEYFDPWVLLAQETIRAIREISPKRGVIYGGAFYNSVHGLAQLPVMDDDYVTYNFHYYEPILFTHQFANWCDIAMAYRHEKKYPADYQDFGKFHADHPNKPEYESFVQRYGGMRCDREAVERDLALADAFQRKTGRATYCGEYGVYEKAPYESKLNWMRDVTEIFNRYHIGRALWIYLGGGFSLWDWKEQKEVDPEVVKIITKTG
jgi:aryl-phospho-beta-D-glucosidase BglC (GH1 family)